MKKRWLCRLAMMLALLLALGTAAEPVPEISPLTLEEYLEYGNETWFKTGKKEYTIQAMMVSGETSFHNDLEVTCYTVTDDGVTVILQGHLGEMWASPFEKVAATYTKLDGSALTIDDFAQKDTYIDIVSIPESDAYFAMHVPADICVTVITAWGDALHTNLPDASHGDGDYLVCRADENGMPDLTDVWVLNGEIFEEYYVRGGKPPVLSFELGVQVQNPDGFCSY